MEVVPHIHAPVNCVMGLWGSFSLCTVTCGSGMKYRSRGVKTPSTDGGLACSASFEQQTCNVHACTSTAPVSVCYSAGDPHFQTFDGNYFDFQGLGPFELVNADCLTLNMQAWHCNYGNGFPKTNAAIAFSLGSMLFEIYGNETYVNSTAYFGGFSFSNKVVMTFVAGSTSRRFSYGDIVITINTHVTSRAAVGYYLDISVQAPNNICLKNATGLCHTGVGATKLAADLLLFKDLKSVKNIVDRCSSSGGGGVPISCTNPLECCAMNMVRVEELCTAVQCHPQLYASCRYDCCA